MADFLEERNCFLKADMSLEDLGGGGEKEESCTQSEPTPGVSLWEGGSPV